MKWEVPFKAASGSQLLKGQLVKTEAVAAELALELQRKYRKSQVTKRGAFDRGA